MLIPLSIMPIHPLIHSENASGHNETLPSSDRLDSVKNMTDLL